MQKNLENFGGLRLTQTSANTATLLARNFAHSQGCDLLKRRRTQPPYAHPGRSRKAACRRCQATQQPGPEGPLKPGLASWFGHRTWLHGLDALPGATALGRRCPAAPSCARANAFGLRFQRTADAHRQSRGLAAGERVCPTAVGAGAVRPRTAVPALGGLSAEGLTPCRLPLVHPRWWASGDCSGRGACAAFGALRAWALRTPASRYRVLLVACRLRPPGTARLLARA